VSPQAVRLPDGRVWLRVADPDWIDPLDPSYAAASGGRWNTPGSFPTLYLNGDVRTARRQIERMLVGSPVEIEDLTDEAFVLIAATLPSRQRCADAVSDSGLMALGLDARYPADRSGRPVPHGVCQEIGATVHRAGFRGVWCRSAAGSPSEGGTELAWFPASARSRARPAWPDPLVLGDWRHANDWSDIGLDPQPDPSP
jgi:hypothetical protein